MRAAHQVCEEPELSRLAPRARRETAKPAGLRRPARRSPDDHEAIAYDWLAQGGKRSRPFITLAAYDALKGGPAPARPTAVDLPDGVRRTALAIEAFHKASLVHDDIEDDDTFRYGRETLHRQYGVGTAINVGDYLIGLGYRLVSRERKELGGDCTADILNRLADAHLKLSEGQGPSCSGATPRDKTLTALDALKIYALKTAPAFEAALYAGVRLAGPAEPYEKTVAEFSKNLGVAFQILNDLKDWDGDGDNKLIAGQDVLAARPTLLLALALEGSARRRPRGTAGPACASEPRPGGSRGRSRRSSVRRLFTKAGVFDKAEKLIEKYRARAEAIADETSSRPSCANCSITWSIPCSTANRRRRRSRRPPPLIQLALV